MKIMEHIDSYFHSSNSDHPSAWCKENWIHWRAVKSAFSVETQLREILLRLKQVIQIFSTTVFAFTFII